MSDKYQKVCINNLEYESAILGTALYWEDIDTFQVTTKPSGMVAGVSIRGATPEFLKFHEEIGSAYSCVFIQTEGYTPHPYGGANILPCGIEYVKVDEPTYGVPFELCGLEPTTYPTYGGIQRSDARYLHSPPDMPGMKVDVKQREQLPVFDERLDQLAYDPMMCNISPEVLGCLRELVRLRKLRKFGGIGPHLLKGKDGAEGLCGGPGVCKWCIEDGRK